MKKYTKINGIDKIEEIIIYEQDEQEEIVSDEKIKQQKEFWDDLFEQQGKSNKILHSLTTSFWTLDKTIFDNTWDESFKQYLNNNKTSFNKINEAQNSFKRDFIRKFVETCLEKNNKHSILNNYDKVLKTWKSHFSSSVLITIFWQIDLKDISLSLLKNNISDLSEEQYDYVYLEFSKEFRRRDLPINASDKNTILQNEKIEFLQLQKTYGLFKKIDDKLPKKDFNPKTNKI